MRKVKSRPMRKMTAVFLYFFSAGRFLTCIIQNHISTVNLKIIPVIDFMLESENIRRVSSLLCLNEGFNVLLSIVLLPHQVNTQYLHI